MAESVTLAHFGRMLSLINQLPDDTYDVHLGSDPRYLSLAPQHPSFTFHEIHSIGSDKFNQALSAGKPVYDTRTLVDYVEDDLDLIHKVKPNLIIGDFRLSLAVSAPKANVPYAAVVNAHWSPYAKLQYPVPDLPFTKIVGLQMAQKIFNVIRPLAFAAHAKPLNQVRRRYGLPTLKPDVRHVYTWGNVTLYPDMPDAVEMRDLPPNHHFIGPVVWSPLVFLPDWWNSVPTDKPIVYVTLGSSGNSELLPQILKTLAPLPISIIASTAGRIKLPELPSNVFLADFLPGEQATNKASLLISNGGSATTQQAYLAGISVIGITTNMDQLLNMQTVERLGAGKTIRAARFTPRQLLDAVSTLLPPPVTKKRGGNSPQSFGNNIKSPTFNEIVLDICTSSNKTYR